jgi:membrane protein implicated in regulation of membrane protease activity
MRTLIRGQEQQNNDEFTGLEGTIDGVIRQGVEWRIRTQGTLWTAYSKVPYTLNLDDRVKVIGRDGNKLRLLIEPL